jgi:hypothetical protein
MELVQANPLPATQREERLKEGKVGWLYRHRIDGCTGQKKKLSNVKNLNILE